MTAHKINSDKESCDDIDGERRYVRSVGDDERRERSYDL